MRLLMLFAMSGAALSAADFTVYIGDSNTYQVSATATDTSGNTYVTGGRLIMAPQGTSSTDVFVTKIDSSGHIVFTTTFGGKASEAGNAIAVDPVGNIWVGGVTSSENFPLRDAFQSSSNVTNLAGGTGFLVKLASDGTVIYSSYFGGLLGTSSVNGVSTDGSGNVYVTGTTNAGDFPTTPNLPAGKVNSTSATTVAGAFISKLAPTGAAILYSALLAGTSTGCTGGSSCQLTGLRTAGVAIAVDLSGNAIIAGNTNTIDLPVTPGGLKGSGAFLAKINATGNQLAYLTYLGPEGGAEAGIGPPSTIYASAVTVDPAGNAYVTGNTNDPSFPATSGSYQPTLNANPSQTGVSSDAFAAKLSPAGAVVWATYLGGPGADQGNAVSVDASEDVWLTGNSASGFPVTASLFANGGAGNFLSQLSADGSKLLYSALFPSEGVGQGLAIDQGGVLHAVGETGLVSTITPAQPFASRILGVANAAQGPLSGRVAPSEVISIYGFNLGPATPASAAPTDGRFPTSLAGVQVFVDGTTIPLLYVSGPQINAEIPAPLSGIEDGGVTVQVANGSSMLPAFRTSVDSTIFGVFQSPSSNGLSVVAAINQNGTLNSPSNPAPAGSIVSIWATGFNNSGGTVDGAVATAADNWCGYCQISIGSMTEPVEYAGAAPGLIDGVMQINFMIPAASSGPQEVEFNNLGVAGVVYTAP